MHVKNEGLVSPFFQRQVAAKVEDLHQNNIDLELMHLNGPDKAFDINVFYKVMQHKCISCLDQMVALYAVYRKILGWLEDRIAVQVV